MVCNAAQRCKSLQTGPSASHCWKSCRADKHTHSCPSSGCEEESSFAAGCRTGRCSPPRKLSYVLSVAWGELAELKHKETHDWFIRSSIATAFLIRFHSGALFSAEVTLHVHTVYNIYGFIVVGNKSLETRLLQTRPGSFMMWTGQQTQSLISIHGEQGFQQHFQRFLLKKSQRDKQCDETSLPAFMNPALSSTGSDFLNTHLSPSCLLHQPHRIRGNASSLC